MSHFTTIQTQVKEIEALKLACEELGFSLLKNAEARGDFQTAKGDYVIKLKGGCDIALIRQTNGTFNLSADLWDGSVEAATGKGYGKLLQLYAVHKATREARKKGHLVKRSQQSNGTIKLLIAQV